MRTVLGAFLHHRSGVCRGTEEVWILLEVRYKLQDLPRHPLPSFSSPPAPGQHPRPFLNNHSSDRRAPASAKSTCILQPPLRPLPSGPATQPSAPQPETPTQVRRQRPEGELTSNTTTVAPDLGDRGSGLFPCRLTAKPPKSPAHTEGGSCTPLGPQSPRKMAQIAPW